MRGIFQAGFGRGLLVLALAGAALWADRPQEAGAALLRNWSPKEYGAEAQNWAVAQDSQGLVYAGNNAGVLEFDGVRWRLIPMPKGTTVRSLGLGPDGKVYVGSVGEMGYLEGGGQGGTQFVSLLPKLPPAERDFSDVWVTASTSRGMLFQTRESLLLFTGSGFRRWKAETTFHIAFVVDDRIFVRQRERGLMELIGDRLVLVPGGERFATESVFAMLPLGGGRIFLGSRNLGCFLVEKGTITRFPTEADSFLKENPLYFGLRLKDGTLALATTRSGVVFLDSSGKIRHRLNRDSGLHSENVKSMFVDHQSALWLALDHGLARVEWPSPFSQFDERHGLQGTTWALHRHNGVLRAATGQGQFSLEPQGLHAAFHPVLGTRVQNLCFLEVANHLLVGSGEGVLEIGPGGKALPVRPSSNVAISLARSRANPRRVFVGLQGGLAALRLDASDHWVDEGLIPGLAEDFYSLAEDSTGALWLGSAARGVYRVRFPLGWPEQGSTAVQIQRFDMAEGLPKSVNNQVVELQGQVLVLGHEGIYRFLPEKGRFEQDPRFANLFPEGPRRVSAIQASPDGRLVLATLDRGRGVPEVGWALPQQGGHFRWDPTPFRRFKGLDVVSLLSESDGVIWLGGPTGLVRWEPALAQAAIDVAPTLVRRVSLLGHEQGQDTAPEVRVGAALRYADNALRFEFATPAFEVAGANRYQVYLEGLDRTWSAWSSEGQKDYTNLPEGTFTFRVRGMDLYGRVSAEGRFPFQIKSPWYRSWWAITGYFGGVFLALRMGYLMRTRLLRERNRDLEQRVEASTLELTRQALALATANEELRALDAQKNQFLGIVAHDLRNPLQGILLTAELIGEEEDIEEIHRRSRQIVKEGTGMSHLVGRFLDVAALESGKVKATLETASMTALMKEVMNRHLSRAQEKRIRMEQSLPAGPAACWMDPKLVGNALDNLISNALKFSPHDRTVTLTVAEGAETVQVRVADQGPGLTVEDKAKLFGRFTPLSSLPTGGEKSVGLGLSITKQLVELSGGRIWVESEAGRGAAFIMEFPIG